MSDPANPAAAGGRTLVFVYGTLKRGGENHALLANQRFLGTARTTSGYRLYGLDGYPGLLEDPQGPGEVSGEVWEVDASALRALDELEGVDEGLYVRAAVRLAPPFDQTKIDTYLYLRSITGWPDLGREWPIP